MRNDWFGCAQPLWSPPHLAFSVWQAAATLLCRWRLAFAASASPALCPAWHRADSAVRQWVRKKHSANPSLEACLEQEGMPPRMQAKVTELWGAYVARLEELWAG